MRNKNRMKKMSLALVLIVGLLSVVSMSTAEDTRELGIKLRWRSENNNQEQLPLAIEKLYVVLYNIGNLPTRTLVDPQGRTIEAILRSEDLFFGSHFPPGVDSVMCDINPHRCERVRERVPTKSLPSVSDHVGGYRKSNGRWRNDAGSAINVPDLDFSPYTIIAEVPYRAGDDIEQLVNRQDADCSQWRVSCSELVRILNRALFDPKRAESQPPDTIKLPVKGVEADLVVTGTKNSDVLQTADIPAAAVGTKPYLQMEAGLQQRSTDAPAWRSQMRSLEPADIAIKSLSNSIVPFGRAEARSFTDPGFSEQNEILSLIHHPFLGSSDDPIELQKPVTIAVLDSWLDKEHCAFEGKVDVDEELMPTAPHPGSKGNRAKECGSSMTTSPTLSGDHGTHVAGLIASAKNGKGVVGLDPYAKLKYFTIDYTRLNDPKYRVQLANKILSFLTDPSPMPAANISWEYTNQGGGADPIKKAIKALKDSTLFVVAVGNAAQSRDGSFCPELPVCHRDFENVISVVGLDRNPDPPGLWTSGQRGSNWSQEFSVGAIADAVLSTTHGNFTGRMSGTSQAAPQVTAAAALLYSVYETYHKADEPELLPIRIKNRLIYTSSLFTELLDKAQGGRLNVERALDVSRAYLTLQRKNEEQQNYRGRVTEFGPDYIQCNRDQRRVKFKDLRRMFYDQHRQRYVVFLNSKEGNRDSPLERITDCALDTLYNNALMETHDGETVSFQFRDIRDYVSPMF